MNLSEIEIKVFQLMLQLYYEFQIDLSIIRFSCIYKDKQVWIWKKYEKYEK